MDTFQKDGETYAGRWAFDDYNTLIRGKTCFYYDTLKPIYHQNLIFLTFLAKNELHNIAINLT
jgi:hypothetical protein